MKAHRSSSGSDSFICCRQPKNATSMLSVGCCQNSSFLGLAVAVLTVVIAFGNTAFSLSACELVRESPAAPAIQPNTWKLAVTQRIWDTYPHGRLSLSEQGARLGRGRTVLVTSACNLNWRAKIRQRFSIRPRCTAVIHSDGSMGMLRRMEKT